MLINWTSPFPVLGVSGVLFHLHSVFDRNSYEQSVDPDQTPRSAASDLGLHCLPMFQKWDTRLIWVNGCKKPIEMFVLRIIEAYHPVLTSYVESV